MHTRAIITGEGVRPIAKQMAAEAAHMFENKDNSTTNERTFCMD